nr:hypothetical protein Iba_chr06aCG20470 [Ipomoea batatas]
MEMDQEPLVAPLNASPTDGGPTTVRSSESGGKGLQERLEKVNQSPKTDHESEQGIETNQSTNEDRNVEEKDSEKASLDGESSTNSWEDVPEELLEEIKLLSIEIGEETGTDAKQNIRDAIRMARRLYAAASKKNREEGIGNKKTTEKQSENFGAPTGAGTGGIRQTAEKEQGKRIDKDPTQEKLNDVGVARNSGESGKITTNPNLDQSKSGNNVNNGANELNNVAIPKQTVTDNKGTPSVCGNAQVNLMNNPGPSTVNNGGRGKGIPVPTPGQQHNAPLGSGKGVWNQGAAPPTEGGQA